MGVYINQPSARTFHQPPSPPPLRAAQVTHPLVIYRRSFPSATRYRLSHSLLCFQNAVLTGGCDRIGRSRSGRAHRDDHTLPWSNVDVFSISHHCHPTIPASFDLCNQLGLLPGIMRHQLPHADIRLCQYRYSGCMERSDRAEDHGHYHQPGHHRFAVLRYDHKVYYSFTCDCQWHDLDCYPHTGLSHDLQEFLCAI